MERSPSKKFRALDIRTFQSNLIRESFGSPDTMVTVRSPIATKNGLIPRKRLFDCKRDEAGGNICNHNAWNDCSTLYSGNAPKGYDDAANGTIKGFLAECHVSNPLVSSSSQKKLSSNTCHLWKPTATKERVQSHVSRQLPSDRNNEWSNGGALNLPNDNLNQLYSSKPKNYCLMVHEISPLSSTQSSPNCTNPSLNAFPEDIHWTDGYNAIKIGKAQESKKSSSLDNSKAYNDAKNYMQIASEYRQMDKYRVRAKEITTDDESTQCIICAREGRLARKVFFPCEHKPVCEHCFARKQFKQCPLCNSQIKLILDHTGNEHDLYQKWLDEVEAYVPLSFQKNFELKSKKAIESAKCNKGSFVKLSDNLKKSTLGWNRASIRKSHHFSFRSSRAICNSSDHSYFPPDASACWIETSNIVHRDKNSKGKTSTSYKKSSFL